MNPADFGIVAFCLLLAVLIVFSIGETVDRRRAWNLWMMDLIDDEELRRRIDR